MIKDQGNSWKQKLCSSMAPHHQKRPKHGVKKMHFLASWNKVFKSGHWTFELDFLSAINAFADNSSN
jgi:alpha-galactosidase